MNVLEAINNFLYTHEIFLFTITAQIVACSLANFYHQQVDRHMNL